MFLQELLQRFPASTNPHHHSATQDADQTQLLGVTKLQEREKRRTVSELKAQDRDGGRGEAKGKSLLTLYWPSATRVTQNFLEQVHLDICSWICGKFIKLTVNEF